MTDRDLLFMLYGALKATGLKAELIRIIERHLFGGTEGDSSIQHTYTRGERERPGNITAGSKADQ